MRPSYVLGGQNMIVAYNSADVTEYMGVITKHVDMSHPVLMDKYILGTECEVDAICDGTDYLVPGIMQQVERTGVHSGDSICVYPPYNFPQDVIDTLVDYTGRFARELKVVGLVNVQYAVQDGKVYVIEVNPRSSRTVPYISKVTGVPMVDLAVRCTLGEKLKDMGYGTGLWRNGNSPYYAVKVPVYSFLKLHGVDTMLGPEMKSTGEVLGIAPNMHEALIKGLVAAGYQFKTPGPGSCVIISVKDSDKKEAAELAWKLHDYGYKIYGTPGTARYLNSQMVPCSTVRQMSEERPNVLDLLESGLVDYIISTSPHGRDPHRDSVKFRNDNTREVRALDTLRHDTVDGIILIATMFTPEHHAVLQSLHVPVVIVGQQYPGFSCVFHDDFGAAQAATAHMLQKGRRKPGYLGVTLLDKAVGLARREGFDSALRDAGFVPQPQRMSIAKFNMESGYHQAEQLFGRAPGLDCLFCATDSIALGALQYCRSHSLRVPDDIMIAAVGDNRIGRVAYVPLTSAHLHYRTAGDKAARLLLDMLADPPCRAADD